MFLACTVFPIGLLSWFSISEVGSELTKLTHTRLHQACKSAGMTLAERLQLLETDLDHLAEDLTDPIALPEARSPSHGRIYEHFEELSVLGADGQVLAASQSNPWVPELDAGELSHLDSGRAVLALRRNEEVFAEPFLVKRFATPMGKLMVFGQINRAYLFGGDNLLSPDVEFWVMHERAGVVFSTDPGSTPMGHIRAQGRASGRFEWTHGGAPHLASYRTIFIQPQFFNNLELVHSQEKGHVLDPVTNFKWLFLLVMVVTFVCVVYLSMRQIGNTLRPIDKLRDASARIGAGHYSSRVKIDTGDEFEDLAGSFNEMAAGIQGHLRTMTTLNEIGVALSMEREQERLIALVVRGAMEVADADAATVYLTVDDRELQPVARLEGKIKGLVGGTSGAAIPLRDDRGNPNIRSEIATVALRGETVDVDDRSGAGISASTIHRVRRVCVPMKSHEDEIIGVLDLVKAGSGASFTREQIRLAESVASQAAVALTRDNLTESFRSLFEALIDLISTAIDDKSPYTGDHCRRVPVLAMRLAEAACATRSGPLADFSLTEAETYELKIASMLHDCGKVTTPVHVIDKATKLETIMDRIDLVDLRFEVIKRDRLIERLRKEAALENPDGAALTGIALEYGEAVRTIKENRAFLRQSNLGGETMAEELRQRIRDLAEQHTWIDLDGNERPFLTPNEVENLTIPKGTLTPEERKVINHHMTATIQMLEQLPYPRSLRNVPHIAGSHHERMDGRGFPKGLKRDEILMQGRILGIADVFEALTAKDRPYKPGKPLSETLRILGLMAVNGHIDPDLFQVFVSEKVYLDYALEYLDPEQIDEVRHESLPGFVPPPEPDEATGDPTGVPPGVESTSGSTG